MTKSRLSLIEQVKRLAKLHRHNGESDEEIDNYVLGFYDRFYLYVKNGHLRGYADYYIIDKTVYIYDLVCHRGCLKDMWAYCKDQMKELGINRIVFRRPKEEERGYGRR
jgi:hypothetical protein